MNVIGLFGIILLFVALLVWMVFDVALWIVAVVFVIGAIFLLIGMIGGRKPRR